MKISKYQLRRKIMKFVFFKVWNQAIDTELGKIDIRSAILFFTRIVGGIRED